MSPAALSEAAGLARDVETLGRDLSHWLGNDALPPEAAEAFRLLIDLSGRLAALHGELAATIAAQAGHTAELAATIATQEEHTAELAATIAAQEKQIGELVAQIAALTGQIARLQRDLYGSRSEKRKAGGNGSDGQQGPDGQDSRRGGKPGRRKDRGDALNDTGLRFNDQAPVIDITVMPPEIEGLSEDDYEVISERVHCRLATLEFKHVVIRYHHIKVKIRETGTLVSAPARESVFKNSCADVSFVAGLLIDKFLWHLPLYRQHRMLAAAGITVNRGSLSQWANRAIALLKPIHEAQWRSVLESAVIQMDETPIRAGRHPGKPGSMKKGYFWPILGDRGEVVFPFSTSRAHRHAATFLGDYTGTLVSDGYGAYEAYVAARNGAVKQQNCWINVAVILMLRWPKKVRLDSGIAGISATFHFERHPNSVAGFPATTVGHPFFCSLPFALPRRPEATQVPGCSHCRTSIAERRSAVSRNRDPGIGILPLTAT